MSIMISLRSFQLQKKKIKFNHCLLYTTIGMEITSKKISYEEIILWGGGGISAR